MRLFGHPIHPPLTHFPIALWIASFACDLVGAAQGNAEWWTMGFWSAVAGLALALPTAVTGFLDYVTLPDRHPGERTACIHMATMLASTGLVLVEVLLRARPGIPFRPILVLVLSGAACVLLFLGGWLGATLVFRHGVGVER